MFNFKHPLSLSVYVLACVGFLFFVSSKTKMIANASPTQSLTQTVKSAQAVANAPANPHAAARLAEHAYALGLVRAALTSADGGTIARVTGVDVNGIKHVLETRAVEVATAELDMTRDQAVAVWS